MSQKKSRRTFIELGLKTSLALPLLSTGLYGCSPKADSHQKTSDSQKKIKN